MSRAPDLFNSTLGCCGQAWRGWGGVKTAVNGGWDRLIANSKKTSPENLIEDSDPRDEGAEGLPLPLPAVLGRTHVNEVLGLPLP